MASVRIFRNFTRFARPASFRFQQVQCHKPFAVRFFTTANGAESKEEQKAEKPIEEEKPSGSAEEPSPKDFTHEQLLAEYSKLKELHANAEEEIKSLKNKLAYALADIDNVRKISRKDVANAREFALKDFGKDLLDVVDNCERAISIFPAECKVKGHPMASIYTGLEMTANVMIKVFDKHGVVRIPVEPKVTEFDPNFHDAVFQQPVEGLPAGIIFALLKTGWTLNNRVIRAAQVGVSADPPEEEAKESPAAQ